VPEPPRVAGADERAQSTVADESAR
jgi:hypothetical protein